MGIHLFVFLEKQLKKFVKTAADPLCVQYLLAFRIFNQGLISQDVISV